MKNLNKFQCTFNNMFDFNSMPFIENMAVIDSVANKDYTYKELNKYITAVAKGLLAKGLNSQDILAVMGTSSANYLVLTLAALKLGITISLLDVNYKPRELQYILNKCKPKMFVGDKIVLDNLSIYTLLTDTLPLNKSNIIGLDNESDIQALIEAGSPISDSTLELAISSVQESNNAAIHFTSGTTGHPKAVVHTYQSIVNGVIASNISYNYTSEDTILLALPMSHVMGYELTALLALSTGATLVTVGKFRTNSVLDALEEYKCTAFHGVPTMYHFLLNERKTHTLESLKIGMIGGSVTSAQERLNIIQKLGLDKLINVYGQTEILAASQTDISIPIEEQVKTTGKPLNNVMIRVIDPLGQDLPAGSKGEILIKTTSCMLMYLDDTHATLNTLKEDWVYTGDLGYLTEDGYLVLDGRIKDIIIKGGENISPTEIENVLKEYPLIQNACVLGQHDPLFGEEIVAIITTKDNSPIDISAVQLHCCENLAKYKVPKHIKIVTELPVTSSGKIQKYKLKEVLNEVFNN